jgi:hypothetical protein
MLMRCCSAKAIDRSSELGDALRVLAIILPVVAA